MFKIPLGCAALVNVNPLLSTTVVVPVPDRLATNELSALPVLLKVTAPVPALRVNVGLVRAAVWVMVLAFAAVKLVLVKAVVAALMAMPPVAPVALSCKLSAVKGPPSVKVLPLAKVTTEPAVPVMVLVLMFPVAVKFKSLSPKIKPLVPVVMLPAVFKAKLYLPAPDPERLRGLLIVTTLF